MLDCHRGLAKTTVAFTLLVGFACTGPAFATEKEVNETYNTVAVGVNSVVRGATRIKIHISRWSTAEERESLIAVIGPEKHSQVLYDALQKQMSVGHIQLQGELAYDLRYAREILDNGRRLVVMAMDRPLIWEELTGGSRSKDYNVGMIVLDLDPETGEGTGALSIGTRIRREEAEDRLIIETAGVEPINLTQVKKVK